ncbi:MAG: ATP-binding protein [Candidatus Limnocylindrales bacterium]
MSHGFVDRHRERAELEDAWSSGQPELVVVHGRRRVGKSALLARFAAGKAVTYYVAAEQLERDQLSDLGRALAPMASGLRRGGPPRLAIRDWDEALSIVANAAAKRRIGLVLDEFPYLVVGNPALPSLIQRWWDTVGSKSNVVLVLSGSQQSMMRSLVSSEGALYERPSRAIHLRPFDYFHAGQFAKAWPAEDRVRLYAVAGGVPDYLEEFDTSRPLRDELLRLAFSPAGRLFREAPDLLRSEFTEPRTYETVLRAMASGYMTPGEIATQAGLASANRVTPYLERLIDLDLVERRVPPPEASLPRSRNSQYVVADQYLRFYFALVDPWRSAIQQGQGTAVLAEIWGEELDRFVSRTFEEIARQHLRRLAGTGEVGPFTNVGFWWFNGGDIDAAALAGLRLVAAGTAKWTRDHLKPADLADLRRDCATVAPGDQPRLFAYSRSGFDRNLAGDPDVTLVGLRDLFAADLDYERPRGGAAGRRDGQ